jgi:hypothetical protein
MAICQTEALPQWLNPAGRTVLVHMAPYSRLVKKEQCPKAAPGWAQLSLVRFWFAPGDYDQE